jgi:hypothetical protein
LAAFGRVSTHSLPLGENLEKSHSGTAMAGLRAVARKRPRRVSDVTPGRISRRPLL